MPWIVGLAFATTIGIVSILRFRQLRNLHRRIQDGSKKMDDDWDPYT